MPNNPNVEMMQNWINSYIVPKGKKEKNKYEVTSPFGCRKLDSGPDFHIGIDFGTPPETKIDLKLSKSLTVITFQENLAGLYLYLHDSNDEIYRHTFMHLVKVEVSGDNITIYTGNTGLSDGPHLHYQIEVPSEKWDQVPQGRLQRPSGDQRPSYTQFKHYTRDRIYITYAIDPAVFYNFLTGYEYQKRFIPPFYPPVDVRCP